MYREIKKIVNEGKTIDEYYDNDRLFLENLSKLVIKLWNLLLFYLH